MLDRQVKRGFRLDEHQTLNHLNNDYLCELYVSPVSSWKHAFDIGSFLQCDKTTFQNFQGLKDISRGEQDPVRSG